MQTETHSSVQVRRPQHPALLAALGLLLVAAACRPAPCTSAQDGIWRAGAASLDLEGTCELYFYGPDGCSSSGTYSEALATQGAVAVSIVDSSGGVCLPAGKYECAYTETDMTLHWDCGAGAQNYSR